MLKIEIDTCESVKVTALNQSTRYKVQNGKPTGCNYYCESIGSVSHLDDYSEYSESNSQDRAADPRAGARSPSSSTKYFEVCPQCWIFSYFG